MSCYCDYDRPEFISTTIRTARKTHKCCECGHIIQPNEKYEHVAGKWDGDFSTFNTCEMCADLRDSLVDNGGCYQYGGLNEEYWEHLHTVLPCGADEMHARIFTKHRGNDQTESVN